MHIISKDVLVVFIYNEYDRISMYKYFMKEADLLKYIGDHHFSTIKMAEVCLEKKVVPQVRQASLKIIDDLRSEIDLIIYWLRKDHGIEYQPRILTDHLEMIESFDFLYGFEFETVYLEKMADHDRELSANLIELRRNEYSRKLEEMIQTIIEEQSAEIHLFNTLLKIRV